MTTKDGMPEIMKFDLKKVDKKLETSQFELASGDHSIVVTVEHPTGFRAMTLASELGSDRLDKSVALYAVLVDMLSDEESLPDVYSWFRATSADNPDLQPVIDHLLAILADGTTPTGATGR